MTLLTNLIGIAVMLTPSQGPTPIVVINNETIQSTDYYRRVEHLNGVYAQFSGRLLEVPPGLIALDRIINEHLILQLAALHSVSPKADEIDAAYAERVASDPMMLPDAQVHGITVDELKYQISIDLARFKLVTEGVIVTDQEVQDKYKTAKERYVTPKLVTIRYVVVDSDADKAAVDADLAANKPFEEVVKSRSKDVSKLNGGLLKDVPLESFDHAIRDGLNAVKIGQTTTWIPVPLQTGPSPSLSEKILYVGATDSKPLPLDDRLRESIRREIMLDRGTVKNDVTKELDEMMRAAKVDIKDPAFAKAWEDLRRSALGKSKPPAGSGG